MITKQTKPTDLQIEIENEERAFFERSNYHEKLRGSLSSKQGVRAFAQQFYYVRYFLPHMTFVLGAKFAGEEDFWGPLALNLYEELGGKRGPSHNLLYQKFMLSVGAEKPSAAEPKYSFDFNQSWYSFLESRNIEHCMAAFAIYESLDRPDYQLLLEAMQRTHPNADLRFFEVHANVDHFDMFESYMQKLLRRRNFPEIWKDAKCFVLEAQHEMWRQLIFAINDPTT